MVNNYYYVNGIIWWCIKIRCVFISRQANMENWPRDSYTVSFVIYSASQLGFIQYHICIGRCKVTLFWSDTN